MKTERTLSPEPAVRSAERQGASVPEGAAEERVDLPLPPDLLVRPPANSRGTDREWAWPQTLRFVLLMSGLFWLVVGLCVWAFLSAG